jgi:hypothetical protein
MAVEKWKQYLQHQEFIISTDHQSLTYLGDQHLHSDMQKKAMARLMNLKFKIVYKKGKDNIAADALSRVGHLMAIQGVSEAQPLWIQEVLNSYKTDSSAQELLLQLAILSPNQDGFSLDNGIIKKHGKIWVGSNSALQTKVINAFHASAIGGHSGGQATYQRLKQLFS